MKPLTTFPGGKTRALTFGFDDGEYYDRRLAQLFRDYGVKATFFLISGQLGQKIPFRRYGADTVVRRVAGGELPETYRGMEVASHSREHRAPLDGLEDAVAGSMAELARLWGQPVRGLAYPGGEYSQELMDALRGLGVGYARTAQPTYGFALPVDLLCWPPTCSYADEAAEELARRFLSPGDDLRLFYLYGHSYELEDPAPQKGWPRLERLLRSLAGQDGVWYATNGEIAQYLTEV